MDEKPQSLTHEPARILLDIRGIFPLDLFPDRIVIDENKVTITKRNWFTSNIRALLIADLNDVAIDTGLFVASFRLLPKMYGEDNWIYVYNLHKADALLAHRIITGMQIINEEGIDINSLSAQELADKAASLGK